MKKVTVLGAGMVGRAMAIDLAAEEHIQVTSADRDATALARLEPFGIQTVQADLSDAAVITDLVKDCDLVIGAVPGFMGFAMTRTVIEAGVDLVDISFYDEDPFELDALAKEKGVTVVMDIGVAPGMDNILLAHHAQTMNVQRFECLVGGLPQVRRWPYEYKAPFSPIDVLEEYTRPARIVVDGKTVVKPALSEPELLDFDGVGTLEAFNSDGLRSLVHTMDIPNMIERTLRYPGHIEKMRMLRETGFFSKEPVNVGGVEIRPLDLTTKLLFPHWKLGDEEAEFTVMRIIIEGEEQGVSKTYIYDLLDRYDPATKTSSMARTTGYTCTGAARLVMDGRYKHAGVSPPEFLGRDAGNVGFMLKHLKRRGVNYRKREE
jgi:saccharopine dehydrogenase-like NADP-dependent oxidoreductase